MPVELVTQPYVKIAASTALDPDVLSDFADLHGLEELSHPDAGTPIADIINASFKSGSHLDRLAEFAGRFCYRSWDKGRSHEEYLANVIKERHGNVLAHGNVSFILTGVSRALTHELIRHHVGTNPSQESQRYVTAEGGEIEIVGFKANRAVVPPLILKSFDEVDTAEQEFQTSYQYSLDIYHQWLERLKGLFSPRFEGNKTIVKKRAQEAARCFLPNASETRLVWTMNMRAARNVVEQRGDPHADLEIRRLAHAMALELKRVAPAQFFDVEPYTAPDGFPAVRVEHTKV